MCSNDIPATPSPRQADPWQDGALLHQVLDAANLGLFQWDVTTDVVSRLGPSRPDSRLVSWAPQGRFEEVLARCHPADRQHLCDAVQQALAGTGDYECEHRVVEPDGSETWLYERGRVRFENGVPVRLTGVALDITELKRAETARLETERRLALALAAADVGEWDCDLSTGEVALSPRLNRLFGFSPEQSITIEAVRALYHEEDRERVARETSAVLADPARRLLEDEFRIIRPSDGAVRWIQARGEILRDDAGRAVRTIGVMLDITERRQAEAALRESEERLRLAIRAGVLGIWDCDLATGTVHWDERAAAIFGGVSGQPLSIAEAMEVIHPEDRARASQVLEAALGGGASGAYAVEKRIIRPSDGAMRWVATAGQVIFEGSGEQRRPVRVIGLVQDITERKTTEAALHESEARFRTLAEAVPQIVWSAGPDGSPEYYSRYLADGLGADPVDVARGRWRPMLHPDDRRHTAQEWAAAVATGQRYEIEHRVLGRDGAYRWFLSRAVPQRDDKGRIVRWFGTATDIDDQKRIEAALAAALAEKEALLRQKDLLMREVDHRVKNSLQMVQSLLALQGLTAADPLAKAVLAEAAHRVMTVAKVHERLYRSRTVDRVEFAEYLSGLCSDMEAALAGADGSAIRVEADEAELPVDQVLPLGLIVAELVTNALKYGRPPKGAGTVRVSFRAAAGGGFTLAVADDGSGLPAGFDPETGGGLGMHLVSALVRKIGARLDVGAAHPGARFTVTLPAA